MAATMRLSSAARGLLKIREDRARTKDNLDRHNKGSVDLIRMRKVEEKDRRA